MKMREIQISLKYVPGSPIDNKPALVQVMADLYLVFFYSQKVVYAKVGFPYPPHSFIIHNLAISINIVVCPDLVLPAQTQRNTEYNPNLIALTNIDENRTFTTSDCRSAYRVVSVSVSPGTFPFIYDWPDTYEIKGGQHKWQWNFYSLFSVQMILTN